MGNEGSTLRPDSTARYAAYLASALGVGLVGIGAYSLFGGSSAPLAVGLLVIGAIEILAAIYTIKLQRIAWAFSLSTNATLALVFLFGAPRVRDAVGIHMSLALVPCLLFGAAAILFLIAESEF